MWLSYGLSGGGYPDVGYPMGCPGGLSGWGLSGGLSGQVIWMWIIRWVVRAHCVSMLTVFLSAPGCCWAAWARSIGAAATCVVSGLSGALFIGYSAQIYIFMFVLSTILM